MVLMTAGETHEPVSPAPRVQRSIGALGRFWLVEVPRRTHRFSPRLAFTFLDGAWTARWPAVAGFAPVAAFLVGFLAPLAWPGLEVVYTESLSLMAVVIAGAILSGPVGVMLWVGYAFGDLMFGESARAASPLIRLASRLVPLVLLAVPAIVIPAVSQMLVWPLRFRWLSNRMARVWARALLYAAACGVLVFTWAQAMIVLVRPIFGWVGANSTFEAIFPVQVRWPSLVGVAVAAALARVLAQQAVLRHDARAEAVIELAQQLRARMIPRQGLWERVPAPAQVVAVTVLAMVTLSGIYERWFDALAVAAVVAPLEAWRNGLFGDLAGLWGSISRRWPLLVRFLTLVAVSYLAAYWTAAVLYRTQSFRLVLAGALVAVIATYLLLPPAQSERKLTR
jgi:hypothetical protein